MSNAPKLTESQFAALLQLITAIAMKESHKMWDGTGYRPDDPDVRNFIDHARRQFGMEPKT